MLAAWCAKAICECRMRLRSARSEAGKRHFFQSAFTHPNGAVRLTTHPQGFHGLCTELMQKREFPSRFLADSKETLQDFIGKRTEC